MGTSPKSQETPSLLVRGGPCLEGAAAVELTLRLPGCPAPCLARLRVRGYLLSVLTLTACQWPGCDRLGVLCSGSAACLSLPSVALSSRERLALGPISWLSAPHQLAKAERKGRHPSGMNSL